MTLISPKVSIRKIGKAIGGLARRKSKTNGVPKINSNTKDLRGSLKAFSDCETTETSTVGNRSFTSRTEEGSEAFLRPMSSTSIPPDAPPLPEVDYEESPPPGGFRQKRKNSLDRMDSWLFLSGAARFDDLSCSEDEKEEIKQENTTNNNDEDSEKAEEDYGCLAPLPPPLPTEAPSRGMPPAAGRRAQFQRDNSWLNMVVEIGGESPKSVQRLRKYHSAKM